MKYPRAGVYEHYKSTEKERHYYQVIGVARQTETNELLVIYIPLYIPESYSGPVLQARPLGMFMEDVEYRGKTVPRFNYIGDSLR